MRLVRQTTHLDDGFRPSNELDSLNLREIIDSMFLRGLNRSLIDALIKLVNKLPSERAHIQYTLFHTLHSILVRSTVDLDGPPPSTPRRLPCKSNAELSERG